MANTYGIYIEVDQKFIRRYAHLSDADFGKVVRAPLAIAENKKNPSFTGEMLNAYQDLQRQSGHCQDSVVNTIGQNRRRKKDHTSEVLRLYAGILGGFNRLTDEQTGKMVRDVMKYAVNRTVPELSRKAEPVFWTMVSWFYRKPRM